MFVLRFRVCESAKMIVSKAGLFLSRTIQCEWAAQDWSHCQHVTLERLVALLLVHELKHENPELQGREDRGEGALRWAAGLILRIKFE